MNCKHCGIKLEFHPELLGNEQIYEPGGNWGGATIHTVERCRDALAAEYRRMREALEVIATCPPEAVHLMPLAAQAALRGAKGEP
jgi:hypothetical protein